MNKKDSISIPDAWPIMTMLRYGGVQVAELYVPMKKC